MPTSHDNLCENKLRRIIAPTCLEFFETLDSTSTYLRDSLTRTIQTRTTQAFPRVVIARTQTSGRGRRANRWESAPGNLAMTFAFLSPLSLGQLAHDLTRLSVLAAGQVAAATQATCRMSGIEVKWPNDLVLDGRKLAGLLIETVPQGSGTVVLFGVGMNVNQPITLAPVPGQLAPIALVDVLGAFVDLNELAAAIVRRWLELTTSDLRVGGCDESLHKDLWRIGQGVQINDGTRSFAGKLVGLTSSGWARLQFEDGTTRDFPTGTMRAI